MLFSLPEDIAGFYRGIDHETREPIFAEGTTEAQKERYREWREMVRAKIQKGRVTIEE